MRQKPIYIIKLGGSLITDKTKPHTIRTKLIQRILKQIKQAQIEIEGKWLLGNGAGSFAHVPAKQYQTIKGIINDQSVFGAAAVKESALDLHHRVLQLGIREGLPLFSCSASSFLETGDYVLKKSFLSPLLHALKINLIPFFYGDVILDNKKGFTIYSTEKIIEIIVKKLLNSGYQNITVIYLGNTDGVLDNKGKTISEINKDNYFSLRKEFGGSYGTDVTGGMLHKITESLKLTHLGIKVIITNGTKPLMPLLKNKRVNYSTLLKNK